MEGENKKYVRICNLCKKEFESRTRSEYCDKCRKWLCTKQYNVYSSLTYEPYIHDECPQRMGNTRGTMNCPDDDAIRRAEKKVSKQRLKKLETTLADLDETILAHLDEKEEEMMNTCKNCMHLCLCVTLEDSTWETPVWECEINKEKTELDRACKMFEQVDENEKYKFHITEIYEENGGE